MGLIIGIIIAIVVVVKVIIPLIEWINDKSLGAKVAVEGAQKRAENKPVRQDTAQFIKVIKDKYRTKYKNFNHMRFHLPSNSEYDVNEQASWLITELMDCTNHTSSFYDIKDICSDTIELYEKLKVTKMGHTGVLPHFSKAAKSSLSKAYLYISAINEYGLAGPKDGKMYYQNTKDAYGGYYYCLKCEGADPKKRYETLISQTPPTLNPTIPEFNKAIEPTVARLKGTLIRQLKDLYEKTGDDKIKLQSFIDKCKNVPKEVRDGVSNEYVNGCMTLVLYEDALEYEINPYPFALYAGIKYKEYKDTMTQPVFQDALKYAKTAKYLLETTNQTIDDSLVDQINEIIEEENNPVSGLSILDLLNQ